MSKKTLIRICIVLVIIGLMGFSDWSFAEDTTEEGLKFLGVGLNIILGFLGWIWVFLANVAGTFLTNKWVYGEVFGWDVLLWKFWNIVKNFANFGLGLYFVYLLFKGLINQVKGEDVTKNLKDEILWLLIAGIGIQSSRFITATVIDVSSITLAAAGSFPSQIISESPYVGDEIRDSLKNILEQGGKNISLFPKDAKESTFLKTSVFEIDTTALELDDDGIWINEKNLIDDIMPNQENIAGPLYFIGFSFLKTNVITSLNTSSKATIKSTILNMFVQSGTTIIFSIEMLMLCIIALMRIVYLWIFIVLSPIVVLLKCLEKMGDKDLLNTNAVKSLGKEISIKTFLVNTFKPTFIVLGLGIAVIFASLMERVVIESSEKSIDIAGAEISSQLSPTSNTNKDEGDRRYTSIIDLNLIKFVALNFGKTLLEVIFSIIVVIMIYFIIRQTMKLGGGDDFISKKIGGITSSFQDLVMHTPIIPVAGYDKNGIPQQSSISIGGAASLPKTFIDRKLQKRVDEYGAKEMNEIMGMLGLNSKNSLSPIEENEIKTRMNDNTTVEWKTRLDNVKNYINSIQTEEGKGMTLNPQTASNDGFWIQEFTNWLNDRVDKNDYRTAPIQLGKMINGWKNQNLDKSKRSLDTLFSESVHVQTYAQYFFDANDERSKISTWDGLKNADISKKKSEKKSE